MCCIIELAQHPCARWPLFGMKILLHMATVSVLDLMYILDSIESQVPRTLDSET